VLRDEDELHVASFAKKAAALLGIPLDLQLVDLATERTHPMSTIKPAAAQMLDYDGRMRQTGPSYS